MRRIVCSVASTQWQGIESAQGWFYDAQVPVERTKQFLNKNNEISPNVLDEIMKRVDNDDVCHTNFGTKAQDHMLDISEFAEAYLLRKKQRVMDSNSESDQ